MTAWRICKEKHAATAFDGHGARMSGGRWNSPGVAVVYTAAVASQAFLEMLVHADATIASLSYVLIPVEFDEGLIITFDQNKLPRNWREDPSVTRTIGDEWVRASASLVLSVPSAVLDVDRNFLINPAHPDVGQLRIGDARPLAVDERIKALFGGR